MGWLFLVVVVVIAYIGYRKLKAIERDLRQEFAEKAQKDHRSEEPPSPTASDEKGAAGPSASSAAPAAEEQDPLRKRILELVRTQPGVLQTELYSSLGDVPRKRLQAELRAMAEDGVLHRQRDKASYRLTVP
ncbi:MAG TPA: hypothetical protein VJ955_06525 [Desulfuromonadales bacterium]|nr:hypothetical protein [Desulfuromonadales bacterium]